MTTPTQLVSKNGRHGTCRCCNGASRRVESLDSVIPDGGCKSSTDELPNYEMPGFDGIGANEYVVDVTHDAVDFISAVDTPSIWELNVWYHTLNAGFRARISGETDFPCIYDEKVGLGRSYVKLDKLTYRGLDRGASAMAATM